MDKNSLNYTCAKFSDVSNLRLTFIKRTFILFICLSFLLILFSGFVFAVGVSPDVDEPQFMSLYLKFNNDSTIGEDYVSNSSEDIIFDYSSSLLNGTSIDNLTYNPNGGYLGDGAFNFDGLDDYINFGNFEPLNNSNLSTILVWVKRAETGDYHYVYSSSGGGNENGFHLVIWNNDAFRCRYNGLSVEQKASTQTIDTSWHQIGCRYNGTDISTIYDGSIEGSISTSGTVNSTTADIVIGYEGDSTPNFAFNGTIDDLIMYNSALSDSEISQAYALYFQCLESPADSCLVNYRESKWTGTSINYTSHLHINRSLTFEGSNVIISKSRTWTIYNGTFLINNSNLTFENPLDSPLITSESNNRNTMLFIDSIIQGNYASSFNRIDIPINSSYLNISGSTLDGLRYILYKGNFSGSYFNIINSTFRNFITQFADFSDVNNSIIKDSKFKNLSNPLTNHGLEFYRSNNFLIENINISSTSSASGIFISTNSSDFVIKNSFFEKSDGVCVATRDEAHNISWINNTVLDCGSYGIDVLNQAYNILVENNTIINASNGIAFSMNILSENYTSRNNRIYNDRGYGLTFNTAKNGYSYNDYLENSTQRCLSLTDGSQDIYIENITCINNLAFAVVMGGGSNNLTIEGLRLGYSVNYDFWTVNVTNVTIKNIELQGDKNNITFRITQESDLSLYNITAIGADFILFDNDGSTLDSFPKVYDSTNTLFHNTTNICTGSSNNINSNDGNVNITLNPNEACYVLDEYNLTYNSPRTNDALGINRISDNEYHITSTINEKLNDLSVYNIPFDCSRIDRIQYQSDDGSVDSEPSYTCKNNLISIEDLDGITKSSNSNTLIIRETSGNQGGAGGGGSGSTEDEDDTVITGGSTIELGNFTVEYKERWQINEAQEIKIQVFNTSNDFYDPQFITLTFEREDVEHEMVRKSVGIYLVEVEALNGTLNSILSFQVKVEDNGQEIIKTYGPRLVDENIFERITKDSFSSVQDFLIKVITPIYNHPIITIAIIVGIVAILGFAQLIINSKKGSKRSYSELG